MQPLPERIPSDLPAPKLSPIAETVLAKRYLKKNEAGEPIEDARAMLWRVSSVIAQGDARYGRSEAAVEELGRSFYEAISTGRFVPNSPTLMNAGRPLGQLSACFVLPVEDSLSNGERGIYDTLRAMALVHQSGGGTGFSFSRLRPRGDTVRSTMGVASGPVSFMSLYDASTEVVKQGGTRRGANMGILRVDHPDIREFVQCKADTSRITNFNISVAVTRKFMAAVRAGGDYELVNPRTGEPAGRENAAEIFDLIVDGAWRTGEPGVFFIDEANDWNPVPALGEYEATNPCGEQPLLANDVCNLGSINVGAFVKEGAQTVEEGIDWDELAYVARLSTHFLDNVIDVNKYPLESIAQLSREIRRIGLGIMGWADLLVRLGVPYDSDQAVELANRLMGFIKEESRKESVKLAEERGVFPAWEESIWGPDESCARNSEGERVAPCLRLRNCNLTTIAPTGTISIIAGCSGGIEPLFAVAFMRNQAGEMMPDLNVDFEERSKREGWHSKELIERIAKAGHIHFEEVPEETQRVFRTAHDITPKWHVRTQAAFQRHIDSAISKTTNFPTEATREDVRAIYELAYELGCKGVTVYRDGCRPMQVLSTGKTGDEAGEEKEADRELDLIRSQLADARARAHALEGERDELRARIRADAQVGAKSKRSRESVLKGYTVKANSPLGDLYVTINEDASGSPFEVFCTVGKAGGAAMADSEAVGRLISLALRTGVPITAVRDQLRGISCDRAVGFGSNKVLSVPDAVAQAIEVYLEQKAGVQQELAMVPDIARGGEGPVRGGTEPSRYHDRAGAALATCPACGSSQIVYVEGCRKCLVCHYSDCG